MISAWNLAWIIPLCLIVGNVLGLIIALLIMAKNVPDKKDRWY